MTEPLTLRGIELRYVLSHYLSLHGTHSVRELVAMLEHFGFGVRGRPSKAISDALRWEVRLGRVWPRGRGRYGPGDTPRSTEHRIAQRVMALRANAAARRTLGDLVADPARPAVAASLDG